MVAAGTRIDASIVGDTGWWEGTSIRGQLIDAMQAYGDVQYLSFNSALFFSEYTSELVFITRYAHADINDVRATIAGVYQQVVGSRPAVALTAVDNRTTNEAPQQAGGARALPAPPWGDLAQWGLVAAAVVVAVLVVPHLVRR